MLSTEGTRTGYALVTPFTFTASGFTDDVQPAVLQYQFGILLEKDGRWASTPSMRTGWRQASSYVDSNLPTGTMRPVVIAKDGLGSITQLIGTEETVITTEPIPTSVSVAQHYESTLSDMLSANSGSNLATVQLLGGLSATINSDPPDNSTETTNAKKSMRQTMAQTLNSAVGDASLSSTALADTAAQIAADPTQLTIDAQTALNAAMNTMLDDILSGGEGLEASAAQNVMATFSNVQLAASASATSAEKMQQGKSLFSSVMKVQSSIALTLAPGAPAWTSSTTTMVTVIQKNTPAATLNNTVGGSRIMSFGNLFDRRTSADLSVMSTSVISTAKPAIPWASDRQMLSNMNSVSILDAANNAVSLTGMTPPADVQFSDILATNGECVYFDTADSTWKSIGVTTEYSGTSVTCKSTHLTDFVVAAPAIAPTPALLVPTPTPTPITPMPNPIAPTLEPSPVAAPVVAAVFAISLEGVTTSNFDENAQESFKDVVAAKSGNVCGLHGTSTCSSGDVSIISYSRRALQVSFSVNTCSNSNAEAVITTLENYIASSSFRTDLAAAGSVISTGITLISTRVVTSNPTPQSPNTNSPTTGSTNGSNDSSIWSTSVYIIVILLGCALSASIVTIVLRYVWYHQRVQKVDVHKSPIATPLSTLEMPVLSPHSPVTPTEIAEGLVLGSLDNGSQSVPSKHELKPTPTDPKPTPMETTDTNEFVREGPGTSCVQQQVVFDDVLSQDLGGEQHIARGHLSRACLPISAPPSSHRQLNMSPRAAEMQPQQSTANVLSPSVVCTSDSGSNSPSTAGVACGKHECLTADTVTSFNSEGPVLMSDV